MITIKKAQGKDFVVLNLTDFHLSSGEWELSHKNGAIINHTLNELFERAKPDLVTVSGDLAWCGDVEGVEAGETLTIIAGTRLWKGSEYYTASEDIIVYYNGAKWIVGDDGEADSYVGTDDFDYINSNLVEEGIHKTPMSTKVRQTTQLSK